MKPVLFGDNPNIRLHIQANRQSKPLPNYQEIVLHRIKDCQWN